MAKGRQFPRVVMRRFRQLFPSCSRVWFSHRASCPVIPEFCPGMGASAVNSDVTEKIFQESDGRFRGKGGRTKKACRPRLLRGAVKFERADVQINPERPAIRVHET